MNVSKIKVVPLSFLQVKSLIVFEIFNVTMCPRLLEHLYFTHFRMEETLAKLQTSLDDIQQAKPNFEDAEAFLGQHLIRKRSSDQQVSKLNVGLDQKPLTTPHTQN